MPAILINVAQFAQSFLSGSAAEARIARKFLARRGIAGTRYVWTAPGDVVELLDTVDDQTDLLLDMQDLLRGG